MIRFEAQMIKRVEAEIAVVEQEILSGNLDPQVYKAKTAVRETLLKVVNEFIPDVNTALQKD